MISGRFINFKTRVKYSALGNLGRSCCFKRAERHHEEDLQKTFRRNGFEIREFTFPPPPTFFSRGTMAPRFCGGPWLTTAMRPSCLQGSLIPRSQNGQQHAGLLLESSQVKLLLPKFHRADGALLVVLHEFMLLTRFRFR